jgi:hypothetical protein
MEIIVITLYFAIEVGFGVSFELLLPRKNVKSLFILQSLLYNIIILCSFDIVIFCSCVCGHLSLFGYFSPFEFRLLHKPVLQLLFPQVRLQLP